jgi:hypothetical protein
MPSKPNISTGERARGRLALCLCHVWEDVREASGSHGAAGLLRLRETVPTLCEALARAVDQEALDKERFGHHRRRRDEDEDDD